MKTVLKAFSFLGLISALSAWVVIDISIVLNPWFDIFRHAFSDLGGPEANYPWVYNFGLISVSILVFLYSIYLATVAGNKIEVIGSAFLMIASVFLALIGLFPAGTRPHTFVSTWFFIQMDLAIIAWGLGLLVRGLRDIGSIFIAMGIISPILALILEWPSIAVLEAFGIAVIDLWVLLMFFKVHRASIEI